MTHENVEIVREATVAWNEGGVDALLAYLDADIELHAPQESMEPGIYRGHDGVRDYIGRLTAIFGGTRMEPLEIIDVDAERVVAVIRLVVRSAHSEASIDANWAWLVTLGANKQCTRLLTFTDKAQALRAVGPEE